MSLFGPYKPTIESCEPTLDELLEQCGQWAESEAEPFRDTSMSRDDLQAEAERRSRSHYPPSMDEQFTWLNQPGEDVGDGLRATFEMVFRALGR
jgi:hypothetical protein